MNNKLIYKKVSYIFLSLIFSISVSWIVGYLWSVLLHDSYLGNSLTQVYFSISFSPLLFIFLVSFYFAKFKSFFDYIVAAVITAIVIYFQYEFLSFVPIYYSFISFIFGTILGSILGRNSN